MDFLQGMNAALDAIEAGLRAPVDLAGSPAHGRSFPASGPCPSLAEGIFCRLCGKPGPIHREFTRICYPVKRS